MKTFLNAIGIGCLAFGSVLVESFCGAATVTFANTNVIVVNDTGPFGFARATPYPTTINVTGFPISTAIQNVTLTLHDLRHQTPGDLDMLLLGPGGQNVIVLSDAGGGFADPDVSITITLDDNAASEVPEYGPEIGSLASGTYRPTNFGDGDVFPLSAPSPSTATNFAVFSGSNPNGNWQLYIVDDDALDSGSISNGWSLTIQTVTVMPRLAIAREGSNVTVHWSTNATGYVLQSTTNLVSPILWTANASGPAVVSGENTVTNVVSGTKRFYRLIQ